MCIQKQTKPHHKWNMAFSDKFVYIKKIPKHACSFFLSVAVCDLLFALHLFLLHRIECQK